MKRRGRPRSTVRHHAILESTRALLASGPYEQLTIEAIAAEAGVSKQTIYKWWPSKAAIVTEAVISGYLSVTAVPPADTGDISADLRTWLHARFGELEDPAAVALIRAMTAAAAEGTDTERIYNRLALPHRQYLLQRLTAASRHGQLRPGADLEAAVDAILGFLLFQTLSRGRPADQRRAPTDSSTSCSRAWRSRAARRHSDKEPDVSDEPMTILISGAFGQVGQRVTALLLGRGRTVIALDVSTDATEATARALTPGPDDPGTLVPAFVNLLDAEAVRALVAEHRPGVIVHLAAVLAPACYNNPAQAHRVNVEGTANLVNAARATG